MRFVAHTDGGCRPTNPGPAGIGVVLLGDNQTSVKLGQYIGIATNNEAEYRALIEALKWAVSLKASSLVVYSDSELMVRQVSGQYVVGSKLQPLYNEVLLLLRKVPTFAIHHIPREENREADALATAAIESKKETVLGHKK